MIHPVCVYLFGFIFVCCPIIRARTSCPHPDVPADGNYTPKQPKYEHGDYVSHECKKGFALWGEKTRTCKLNGDWLHHSPFCDHAIKLKNPSVEGKKLPFVERVTDGSITSCFKWSKPYGEHMYVHLATSIVIRTLKLYLKEGPIKIEILTGVNNNMTSCGERIDSLETDQWIIIKCKSNVVADMIKILATETHSLSICEIEAYGKTEDGCDYPPSEKVPNGYFEVSRSKAILICSDGYKSGKHNRLVCENGRWRENHRLKCEEVLCDPRLLERPLGVEWTFPETAKQLSVGTRSTLKCSSGYRKVGAQDYAVCQMNGKWTKTEASCVEKEDSNQKIRGIVLGIVGVVVVLVVIGLLVAIICYVRKQKRKEVVVVFQPKSNDNVEVELDREYEYAHYESLMDTEPVRVPEPPSTPRPLAKLSTMSRGGDTHSTSWKGSSFSAKKTPDTMKPSVLYGS